MKLNGNPLISKARNSIEKCWEHHLEVLGVSMEIAKARGWQAAKMSWYLDESEPVN
jgi:hypothetical protein